MSATNTSGMPIYFQIADAIRQKIRKRELLTGDRLPSEHELISLYGASRGTVRKALQHLLQEGLIQTFPGKGSVVASPGIEYDAGKVLGYFSHVAKEAGRVPTGKTLMMKMLPEAPDFVQEKLHIGDGEPVLFLKRLRFIDGEPWTLETSWFRKEIGEIIQKLDIESGSLYEGLQKEGISFLRSKNRIAAQILTDEDCYLFEQPQGTAALNLSRVMYLEDDTPFEYSEDLFRSDKMRLYLDVNYQVDTADFKLHPQFPERRQDERQKN